jgi:hypothetical protein
MTNISESNKLIFNGPQVSALSGNNAAYGSKLVGGKSKKAKKSNKSKKVKKSNKSKKAKKSNKSKTAKKNCWWNIFKK